MHVFANGNTQNTVGLLTYDAERTGEGYNLFYPNNQNKLFLIDNCGRLVHSWTDTNETSFPGTVASLLPDGNLLRSKTSSEIAGSTFGAGGAGGIIEILDWDSNVVWKRIIADTFQRQHHEVYPMPNGNVLCIVWERHGWEEIVENGFDTISNQMDELWSDAIFEINPELDSIVWEWHAWDHLIQDFDSTKLNYGVVAEHTERIDINYQEHTFGRRDWLHSNALDYNPHLDQIMLTVRNFHEIWIIDHSTNINEAASSAGGLSKKGGDLLFRWGNPNSYASGTSEDHKLFFMHDGQWIDNPDSEFDGDVMVYNNMIELDLSLGEIFEPIWNPTEFKYELDEGIYLPKNFTRDISHPDTLKNYSTSASNIQFLPNGNFLMCAARQGFAFELTPDEEVVWEYKVPFKFGLPVPQGLALNLSDNFTNQLRRYHPDFPGFLDKDLTPKDFLESNPNTDFCPSVSSAYLDHSRFNLSVYPNPVSNVLYIESDVLIENACVLNIYGNVVLQMKFEPGINQVSVNNLSPGIYFVKTLDYIQKIIKE